MNSGLQQFLQSLAIEKSDTRQRELARTKNKLQAVSTNCRKKRQRIKEIHSQLQALEEEKQHLRTEILRLEIEIKANLVEDTE